MGTNKTAPVLLLETITLVLLCCSLIIAAQARDGFMIAGSICAVSGVLLLGVPRHHRVRTGARRHAQARRTMIREGVLREVVPTQAVLPMGQQHMNHPVL